MAGRRLPSCGECWGLRAMKINQRRMQPNDDGLATVRRQRCQGVEGSHPSVSATVLFRSMTWTDFPDRSTNQSTNGAATLADDGGRSCLGSGARAWAVACSGHRPSKRLSFRLRHLNRCPARLRLGSEALADRVGDPGARARRGCPAADLFAWPSQTPALWFLNEGDP